MACRGTAIAAAFLAVVPSVVSAQAAVRAERERAGSQARAQGWRDAEANPNTVSAGRLRGRVLTLRLEMVRANWRPEGSQGPTREVYAFAEEGRAPLNPGPLIRVEQGTEIHLTITNRVLGVPLTLHGFQSRPAANDSVVILAPGASSVVTIRTGAPGTYFYWATAGQPFEQRNGIDSQLNGAFVVDPPGAAATSDGADRIFVLSEWLGPVVPAGQPRKISLAINGASWPKTEHLSLEFGQAQTWRVINATFGRHPMHLHGTFFTVEHRGTALRDVVYGADGRRLVTTELMEPGATMLMRWVPDRVGNWLFHCHILAHVSGGLRLGDMTPAQRAAVEHEEHDPQTAMAGLVLGIAVKPGDETAAPDLERHEHRLLTMHVGSAPSRYGSDPAIGAAFREMSEPAPDFSSLAALSQPLVLTRGQPVTIAVKNHLGEATAIHWHGIELESINDGVPGWSGVSGSVMPAVVPGATFQVRFTPPRSGTFIYHTHGHDNKQLTSGLYGPLIVLDSGARFDLAIERIVLLGGPPPAPGNRAAEINRSLNPPPIPITVGVKHRFRIINITNNVTLTVTLKGENGPVLWRAVAKDGADLPPNQVTVRPARLLISVGETYDFEYAPTVPGELKLEVVRGSGANAPTTTALVRVSP